MGIDEKLFPHQISRSQLNFNYAEDPVDQS